MKLTVDQEADALHLRLDDPRIIESEEVSPGVVPDFNEHNQVVGIEMPNLSRRTPRLKATAPEFETAQRPPGGTDHGGWPGFRGLHNVPA
jgi:uncharacterized protein YuzE